MRDKEDFRSTWQDTRLKCARTDEIGILCRFEDDDDNDESMEYVEHRCIYIYKNICITIVHSLYTVQVLYVHFLMLLQIQFNSHSR